jgi:hypothetical protein
MALYGIGMLCFAFRLGFLDDAFVFSFHFCQVAFKPAILFIQQGRKRYRRVAGLTAVSSLTTISGR